MDLASLIAAIASVPGIGPYMVYISFAATTAVTVCSVLATTMPAPTDTGSAYSNIYKIVNGIALSFGHARNLSAPESTGIVGGPGAITAPLIAIKAYPANNPAAPDILIATPPKLSLAFVLIPLMLFVSACSTGAASTATTPVLAKATTDVNTALTLYGIVKGEAQVAVLASPNLAPYVNAAIAKADPIAAALQSATPAAEGLAVSAAALVDQAVALETATAQAIKVVPSTSAK